MYRRVVVQQAGQRKSSGVPTNTSTVPSYTFCTNIRTNFRHVLTRPRERRVGLHIPAVGPAFLHPTSASVPNSFRSGTDWPLPQCLPNVTDMTLSRAY